MSATAWLTKIRKAIEASDPDDPTVLLLWRDAKVLCDLADAAFTFADLDDKGYHNPNRASQYCLDCGADWPCPYEVVRRVRRHLEDDSEVAR